jgi:hypothetical protein
MAECEREHDEDRQHHERLETAAREYPIEHLHHVQRRHQQREIQKQARAAGQQHERLQPLCE